jgi:hypothetical protein
MKPLSMRLVFMLGSRALPAEVSQKSRAEALELNPGPQYVEALVRAVTAPSAAIANDP